MLRSRHHQVTVRSLAESSEWALSSDDAAQEASAQYRAIEPSCGSNVIPRRARPGLAGLRCGRLLKNDLVVARPILEPRGGHIRPPAGSTGVPRP